MQPITNQTNSTITHRVNTPPSPSIILPQGHPNQSQALLARRIEQLEASNRRIEEALRFVCNHLSQLRSEQVLPPAAPPSGTLNQFVIRKLKYQNSDYEGQAKNGEPHGRGTLSFPNGDVLKGEFQNGKIHGKGKLNYANGDVYEGEFKNGVADGQGKKTTAKGDIFEGEFKNGKLNGNGKGTLASGAEYEGEHKNGKPDGQGKLISAKGHVYNGGFKEGRFHGIGKLTLPNGKVYEGEFKMGKKHGKGKLTLPNGNVFDGEFEVRENKLYGNGILYDVSGSIYHAKYTNQGIIILSVISEPAQQPFDESYETDEDMPSQPPANDKKRKRAKEANIQERPKKRVRITTEDMKKLFINGKTKNGFNDDVVKFLSEKTDLPIEKCTYAKASELLVEKFGLSKMLSEKVYYTARKATKQKS